MRVNNYSLYKSGLIKEKSFNFQGSLNSPEAIYDIMIKEYSLHDRSEEYLYCLFFNTQNKLLGISEISHGTVNSSIVSPREILIRALLLQSVNIIIVHNHPSGDPEPSLEDDKVTKRLYKAGELIGMTLLDHIIIGDSYYYSYMEKERFENGK